MSKEKESVQLPRFTPPEERTITIPMGEFFRLKEAESILHTILNALEQNAGLDYYKNYLSFDIHNFAVVLKAILPGWYNSTFLAEKLADEQKNSNAEMKKG